MEFERDGSARYTEIVLEEAGGARHRLAVLPLDDAVRFVDEERASGAAQRSAVGAAASRSSR